METPSLESKMGLLWVAPIRQIYCINMTEVLLSLVNLSGGSN